MSDEEVERSTVSLEEGSPEALHAQHALELLRSEQNLTSGILGGAIAAVVGASLWAGVTFVTGYQIGWMAVGVGFLAGFGVRLLGKGIDQVFGIAGSLLSLAGCGLGNLLAVCGLVSNQQGLPFFDVLSRLDLEIAEGLMMATFSPMDLLFYGIAMYEGYKFSFRSLTPEDLGLPSEEGSVS